MRFISCRNIGPISAIAAMGGQPAFSRAASSGGDYSVQIIVPIANQNSNAQTCGLQHVRTWDTPGCMAAFGGDVAQVIVRFLSR